MENPNTDITSPVHREGSDLLACEYHQQFEDGPGKLVGVTGEIPHDVEIDMPSYWITHVEELQSRMTAAGTATIRPTDSSFTASEEPLLVADPSYWALNVDALVEVLVDPNNDGVLIPRVHVRDSLGTEPVGDHDADREPIEPADGTVAFPYEAVKRGDTPAPLPERLTLTVEEAASTLGISRAFAYEAVRRGEIPSIRIGRRVLVPYAALDRLLSAIDPPPPAER